MLLAIVAACGGCTGGEDPLQGCKLDYLGDEALPLEMKLVARDADEVAREIVNASDVDMILPPQGGRVIFVGAVATNVSACGVELSGALRDLSTGQLRVDARTTNLKPKGGGWGGPLDGDISTFSNIPLCPNQWASTAVHGAPFELTVTLSDPQGKTASQTMQVTPVCGQPANEAECLCQCKQGYVLGQTCP